MITANLNAPLMVGQTGYTLTCNVSGADNLSPTMIWFYRNGSTQTQVGNSRTLPLSPLRLSHAGNYSCNVTSTLLNNPRPVSSRDNQSVVIQSKHNDYIFESSSIDNQFQQFQIHNLLLSLAALVPGFLMDLMSL